MNVESSNVWGTERKSVYSWTLVPTDKTPDGKRPDICLRDKIKAIERDLRDEIDSSKANMTLNQLFDCYMENKTDLRDNTREKNPAKGAQCGIGGSTEMLDRAEKVMMLTGRRSNVEVDGYTDFLFITKNGTVFAPNAVNSFLKNIVEHYNKKEMDMTLRKGREPELLPHISSHNLRHTFCTRLCENESNLKVIQSVMGHSDIKTTMDIYAECTQEKKQEVFANLNGKIMIK